MEKEIKTLKYDSLIPSFLDKFPEFRELAEKKKDYWQITVDDPTEDDDPLVHVFFGYINDSVLELISSWKNKELINRLFSFYEIMANSEDEDVVGVLYATILERLGDDKKILKRARSLMGEKSLALSHEVEKFWGRE